MFRKTLLVASVALATAWAVPASADSILFNPTGGGTGAGVVTIDTLDQAPGNAVAQGITVANAGSFVGTGSSFTLAYQANLGAAYFGGTGGTAVFNNGAGGQFFTFTAQFNETVTAAAPLGTALSLQFGLAPSGTNTFNMYVDTTGGGSDLSGMGFNSGTSILSGVAVTTSPGVNFSDVFTFNCVVATTGCPVALDQHGSNDYPNTTSLPGTGDAFIPVMITSANAAYFPNLLVGSIIPFAITNTSEFTPFITADPSATFFDGIPGVSAVGTVNGLNGANTMLEADAQTSFTLAPVPEPATLTLMGFGLLSAAAARRRQKRQAAK